ncbi:hypothetical protein IL306_005476 [Fusarium sp. DS 682]|nr:hypothetical protein IL306_005476 [Fusarium sp. DS 682]
MLEAIWKPDVVAKAEETSERARMYLYEIIGISSHITEGELSNNANNARALAIMGDGMRAVGSDPGSTSHANALTTPPQDPTVFGPTPPGTSQDDLKSLFTLLCCLADVEIPTNLLCSGAHGTYSWADDGSVTFRESTINSSLRRLLGEKPLLTAALQQLESRGLIGRHSVEGSWVVPSSHRDDRLKSLGDDSSSRWKLEALQLVFSAIPLRNVNDCDPPLDKLMLEQHIKHTIVQLRDADGTYQIPPELRYIVINGLLESSFYPGRPWKEWSIREAEHLIDSTPNVDAYLRTSLRHRESLLGRKFPESESHNSSSSTQRTTPHSSLNPLNKRGHALVGRDRYQDALLCFQEEKLRLATDMANQWHPSEYPSTLEAVVGCELNLFKAKVLRFQGKFKESQAYLEMVHETCQKWDKLSWGDVKGAYALQMADTMLCLKAYPTAKECAEFVLDNPRYSLDSRAISYVVLAECLMVRNWKEAELSLSELRRECTAAAERKRKVRGEPADDASSDEVFGLSKETKLRYHIATAKLAHLRGDWESAGERWAKALNVVNKIPPASGHTTRILLLSQREVFLQIGPSSLVAATQKNIDLLGKVSANSEANYWIPCFMEWQDHLKAYSSSHITLP